MQLNSQYILTTYRLFKQLFKIKNTLRELKWWFQRPTFKKIPTFLIFFLTGVSIAAASSCHRNISGRQTFCTFGLQCRDDLLLPTVSYLVDLYRVTNKQGILLLLLLLGFFIQKVSKTQTDAQHHAWRRNAQINLCPPKFSASHRRIHSWVWVWDVTTGIWGRVETWIPSSECAACSRSFYTVIPQKE